jgi:hypothetical protein
MPQEHFSNSDNVNILAFDKKCPAHARLRIGDEAIESGRYDQRRGAGRAAGAVIGGGAITGAGTADAGGGATELKMFRCEPWYWSFFKRSSNSSFNAGFSTAMGRNFSSALETTCAISDGRLLI